MVQRDSAQMREIRGQAISCQIRVLSWTSLSCRIGCYSLEKSRHEASVLQEKCRICDIFLLNNRPKLAENVEKQAEFSDKNERINRQV